MAGCLSGQETAAWVSFTTTPVCPAKRMSSSELSSSIKVETCMWSTVDTKTYKKLITENAH